MEPTHTICNDCGRPNIRLYSRTIKTEVALDYLEPCMCEVKKLEEAEKLRNITNNEKVYAELKPTYSA